VGSQHERSPWGRKSNSANGYGWVREIPDWPTTPFGVASLWLVVFGFGDLHSFPTAAAVGGEAADEEPLSVHERNFAYRRAGGPAEHLAERELARDEQRNGIRR
jgi:hypothetical protein